MAIRILWSGLTGQIGQAALSQLASVGDVEIVAGMNCQYPTGPADSIELPGGPNIEWLRYDTGLFGSHGLIEQAKRAKIDVVVDFSPPYTLGRAIDLAVRLRKPLVCRSKKTWKKQRYWLRDAAKFIPVFQDRNFSFKAKAFIDEVMERARCGWINDLREDFYEGETTPSEISKIIRARIFQETGQKIAIFSSTNHSGSNYICSWTYGDLTYRTAGFDDVGHDVLEIVKVMAKKPIRNGKFYTLDELWPELPHEAE